MKRFKNILVYVQTDMRQQYALSPAVTLAQNNKAKLTVVDVIEGYAPLEDGDDLPDALALALEQEAQDRLNKMVAPIQSEGIEVETKVLWGKASLEIIKQVIHHQYDLILKTAEGKKPFRKMIFGTTALQLFRKCPCPVWAVKPDVDNKVKRIAVAVDLLHDDESPNLNSTLLELSISLAEFHDSELHLIHVWHVYGEEVLKNLLSKGKINDLIAETGQSRQMLFDNLTTTVKDIYPIQAHLLHGDVHESIPQFVLDKDIDLLVMGTVGRTGVSGLFIGNTAERLLHSVDCSVLTVKPEGFKSPVQG